MNFSLRIKVKVKLPGPNSNCMIKREGRKDFFGGQINFFGRWGFIGNYSSSFDLDLVA